MSDLLNSILDDGIDPRYAAAGDVLVKIAEDEGVDLDDYSDEQIGGMLSEIVDDDGGEGDYDDGYDGGDGGGDYEEGGYEGGDEVKESGMVTHAVVARELSKIASAEGVDLSDLDQNEYNEVYNDLANAMVEPGYFQKQAAAHEKLAEADAIGRAMAHSFDDELHKLAEEKEAASGAAIYKRLRRQGASHAAAAAGAVRGTGRAAKRKARAGGRKVKEMGGRARDAEADYAGRAGGMVEKLPGGSRASAALKRRFQGGAIPRNAMEGRDAAAKAQRVLGRAAAGTAAAGTAAAGGGAYALGKNSYDEDVMATARALLADSGIDPDTGVKVAEDYDDAVINGAVALLEESGYTFG